MPSGISVLAAESLWRKIKLVVCMIKTGLTRKESMMLEVYCPPTIDL